MEEVKATQVTYSSGMPVTVKLAEDNIEMRKGPWTLDEDSILIHYISLLGQGRWDSLAQFAGLKRSGKSCRLRWLNYLRPNLRRGKFTPQEQLLILLLHFRFGNRWAKIAEHLPGRTDNEVKNYWRTKVQKHANRLHCNVNSQEFRDVLRYQWLPSLAEQIRVTPSSSLHEYLMASSSTAHNKTTEVKENISPFLETGIGSTSITSPNVVSSTNSSEAELPPLMDNSLWSFSSSNWCSSFEDGYYLYSSQDQCHSWASVAGSELVPANETLVSSDLDLWLFP